MGGTSSKKSTKESGKPVSETPVSETSPSKEKIPNVETKTQEELKEKLFSGNKLESAAVKSLVDVVFMCDCTGSMSSFIEAAKATVRKMVTDFRDQYNQSSIFVGFIAYRDHCDSNLLEILDLTGDMEEVYKFIEKLQATGGGDTPEAVADALKVAADKTQWREGSLRIIIHILDAPCHGKEYHNCDDSHPKGCPCGEDPKKLLKKLSDMETQYIMMTFGANANIMAGVFKKHHSDMTHVELSKEKMTKEEAAEVGKFRFAFGESMEAQEEKRMKCSSYAAADVMVAKTSSMVSAKIMKSKKY